jgi:hypothetical protein
MEELGTLLLADTSTKFIIIKMAEKTFSKISVLSVISSIYIYILSVNYGGRQTSYKMQGPWRLVLHKNPHVY